MLTVYNQNLHTHGIYCDGKDAYEDTVLRALELEFDCIGFSTHSYNSYSSYIPHLVRGQKSYRNEIRRLKDAYGDRIKILCGIEADMYTDDDLEGYDYIIGSVHYLKIGKELKTMDGDAKSVGQIIHEYYGGDGMRYVKAYYETVAQMPKYIPNCDIIGHIDLLTKHMDTHQFFDTESAEYRKCAIEAIDELVKSVDVFEVNTGAIARGYRTTPYPQDFILKELKKRGCGIIITSDCHDNRFLDYKFDEALHLVKECGFKEVLKMTDKGFEAFGI